MNYNTNIQQQQIGRNSKYEVNSVKDESIILCHKQLQVQELLGVAKFVGDKEIWRRKKERKIFECEKILKLLERKRF